jgi:hypothetical protein
MPKNPLFGKELEDTVSGYKGMLKAICILATGCIHIGLLQKGLDKDGRPNVVEWFDRDAIKHISGLDKIKIPDILGKKVKDTHSGFTGICVTYTEFEHTDPRVAIQGKELHEGIPAKPHTCDLMFVERLDKKPIEKEEKSGCSVFALRR